MDKKVTITIDIEKDILWALFNEAHRQDITLNQLVENILRDAIKGWEGK